MARYCAPITLSIYKRLVSPQCLHTHQSPKSLEETVRGVGGAERHMGGAHRTAKEVYRDRAAGMGNKSHDKKGLSIMAEQSLQSC